MDNSLELLKAQAAAKSGRKTKLPEQAGSRQAVGSLTPVVQRIPAADPQNPEFRDRIIEALIEHGGDSTLAIAAMGCTMADLLAISSRPDFKTRFKEYEYLKVDLPNQIAMRQGVVTSASGGNAYAYKTLKDSEAKDSLSEDDAAYREQMATADSKTLKREILSQIHALLIELERVTAKRYELAETKDP